MRWAIRLRGGLGALGLVARAMLVVGVVLVGKVERGGGWVALA
jgi:hypothetical protein